MPVFIGCHSVRWVPNMWEAMQTNRGDNPVLALPMWVHHISQVSHLMTILSCSTNFYIYLAKHGQIRISRFPVNSDQQVRKNMIAAGTSSLNIAE